MEYQRHHGNPWNINVEIRGKFHGITCYRGISMESHGTPYKLHWFSMEIPWRISVRVTWLYAVQLGQLSSVELCRYKHPFRL